MRRSLVLALALAELMASGAPTRAQTPDQPKVAPGPGEPNWDVILRERYGLSMFGDLLNPVRTRDEAPPGLFKKAGEGPVTFTPLIALGLATVTRGGWYVPGPDPKSPGKHALWSYEIRNSARDLETGKNLPPPLLGGSKTAFDPGDQPFGLWISNDNFNDGGVFTQPRLVAAINARLAKQPYKAMIYPYKDRATGRIIPHSYLIGWEYSTNDDFQDAVCRVDNVELIDSNAKPAGAR